MFCFFLFVCLFFLPHHEASKELSSVCYIFLRPVGKRLCNILNYFVKVQTTSDSKDKFHDPLQIFLTVKKIPIMFKLFIL